MKRIILNILLCAVPLLCTAQISSLVRKYVKHFDIAVSAGTHGFGFEVAAPITKWSQVRFGGILRPVKTYNFTLDIWQPATNSKNEAIIKMVASAMNAKTSSTIDMEGERYFQNLKLLIDFYPIKKHRNFYITAGVFNGKRKIAHIKNTFLSFNTLSYMREYNLIYSNAKKGEFLDLTPIGGSLPEEALDVLRESFFPSIVEAGDMAIPVGTYSHDIYGANGELLHSKGDYVMLRPDRNDVVSMKANVINAFKPYLGIGYSLPVSKDGRTKISLDAGILLWGGVPTITTNVVEGVDAEGNEVTTTIDLVNDVDHIPGSLGKHIRSAKHYPVYPEVSLRFSRTIW